MPKVHSKVVKPYANRFTTVAALLCLIVAFKTEIFFALMAVLGRNYEGSESSPVYIIFIGIIFVIAFVLAAEHIIHTRRIRLVEIPVICLPILLFTMYLFDQMLGRLSASSQSHFLLAIILACPAAVAGMLASRSDIAQRLTYVVDPLMILFTLAVGLAALGSLAGVVERGIGGATYQTASYVGAWALVCNLYLIIFGSELTRPEFTKAKVYLIASFVLLPFQFVATLLTGGRGGFILICVGILYLAILKFRSGKRVADGRIFGLAFLMVPLLVWLSEKLRENQEAGEVIERVFAYLGEDGIDWAGTSGRDAVYRDAIDSINASGFFGYGAFNWGSQVNPHNIFLEMMLNGGILYLLFWCAFLLYLGSKFIKHIADYEMALVGTIALFPAVMLQFSGSYMTSGPFWFVLAFVLCYPDKSKQSTVQD